MSFIKRAMAIAGLLLLAVPAAAQSTLETVKKRGQLVCGVVVNQRANVPRDDFDRLKATLHDAARHGPAAANRAGVPDFRAHLQGRVAWVAQLHPDRGRRLQAAFDTIPW